MKHSGPAKYVHGVILSACELGIRFERNQDGFGMLWPDGADKDSPESSELISHINRPGVGRAIWELIRNIPHPLTRDEKVRLLRSIPPATGLYQEISGDAVTVFIEFEPQNEPRTPNLTMAIEISESQARGLSVMQYLEKVGREIMLRRARHAR